MRAGPTRVRRGTQGHVAEPRGCDMSRNATRTRAAPTWRSILIICLFNLYIKGLQPYLYGKGH